jgi:hypothetical protein
MMSKNTFYCFNTKKRPHPRPFVPSVFIFCKIKVELYNGLCKQNACLISVTTFCLPYSLISR